MYTSLSATHSIIFYITQRENQIGNSTADELKIVRDGTKEYKRAKKVRDLLMEFTTHQERLHEHLAYKVGKILRRSATAM